MFLYVASNYVSLHRAMLRDVGCLLLVGWAAAAMASCCGPAATRWACGRDPHPPLPATTANSSDEEGDEGEDVWGEATPPPNLPPVLEGQDPADVLFETIGSLWEEGNDLVVHMMEYYLREAQVNQANAPETDLDHRWNVLQEARQVVRVYGVRQTLCQLSPWWVNWLERLLAGWRLHDGVGEAEAGDTVGLMQQPMDLAQYGLHEALSMEPDVGGGCGVPGAGQKRYPPEAQTLASQADHGRRDATSDHGLHATGCAKRTTTNARGERSLGDEVEVGMAREVAVQPVVDLERPFEVGEMRTQPALQNVGAAICDAMEDLATRMDRMEATGVIPNDNDTDQVRGQEEGEVGHGLVQCLRSRLPPQPSKGCNDGYGKSVVIWAGFTWECKRCAPWGPEKCLQRRRSRS